MTTEPEQTTPPVRSLPFGLMGTIFSAQVCLGIVLFAIFQEFVPADLGTSDAWGGFLLAAYGATRFCLETPTGAILDRIKRKNGLLLGLAVMLPSVLLMEFARNEWVYLALAAGLGLGTAFLWPAAYSMSADLYRSEHRGRVVGLLNVGQLFGFGLGALIGALLVEDVPRVLFIVGACAVGIAFVVAALTTPTYRHVQERVGGQRPRMRDIMTPQLLFMSFIILTISSAMGVMVPAIRPFGENVLDVSFRTLTISLLPAIVIAGLLYIPAGHLADRAGRLVPLSVGPAMSAAALIFISYTDTHAYAAAAAIPGFAGYALAVPAWNATIMDLAPSSYRGAVIGFSVALTGFGLAVAPFVGGIVVEVAGSHAAFRLSGLVFLAAALAIAAFAAFAGTLRPHSATA